MSSYFFHVRCKSGQWRRALREIAGRVNTLAVSQSELRFLKQVDRSLSDHSMPVCLKSDNVWFESLGPRKHFQNKSQILNTEANNHKMVFMKLLWIIQFQRQRILLVTCWQSGASSTSGVFCTTFDRGWELMIAYFSRRQENTALMMAGHCKLTHIPRVAVRDCYWHPNCSHTHIAFLQRTTSFQGKVKRRRGGS